MYKIIVGLPAMGLADSIANEDGIIVDYIANDDEDIWCDFELDYDIDKHCYYFSFETMVGFDKPDGCKNWIMHCMSVLREYMIENGYDTTKELDMYDVFTTGVNVNTDFETIKDAYAWLKMIVFGFNGKGLL